MPFFRDQIKEEILMNQLSSIIHPQLDCDNQLVIYPLIICSFLNPSRRNLCFSNVVVSVLLNIPVLRNELLHGKSCNIKEANELFKELQRLAKLPKFSKACTNRFRYLTKRKCIESGQSTRNFSDNKQHDAGEFLISVLEHLFKDSVLLQDFDEQIFGGLWQAIFTCSCGKVSEKEISKIPGILPLQLYGQNIQHCLDHYFVPEEIEKTCLDCNSNICEKNIKIILDPSTIIFQLNRYEYNRDEEKVNKKHNQITCPIDIKLPSGSSYSLCSVVNHIGSSPKEGHYNMLLYNNHDDTFVMLDDTRIKFDCSMDVNMEKLQYLITYSKN